MKRLGYTICSMTVALCLIASLFTGIAVRAQVSDEGLEAYWKFDEGSGTTVADQSGKGRNLTVSGNSKWTEGKEGKAFDFDGSTVLLMDGKKQIKAYNLTISMYVKINEFPKSDTGANILVANEGVSALGQGSVDFGFFGNKMYSYVTGMKWDNGDRVAGQTDYTGMIGSWHNVTVVYNQDYTEETGKSFIYIDGKLDGSTDLVMTLGADIFMGYPKTASYPKYNACIGGFKDDSGNVQRSVIGAIDEMKIFSRALSDAEVAELAGSKQQTQESGTTDQTAKEESTGTAAETTEASAGTTQSNASTTGDSGTDTEKTSENTATQTEQQQTTESSSETAATNESTAVENTTASAGSATTQQEVTVSTNNSSDTGEAVETSSESVKSGSNALVIVLVVAALIAAAAGATFILVRKKKAR